MATKKAAAKVKKTTTKKSVPVPCGACNATGLQDRNTLCPVCKGHGKI